MNDEEKKDLISSYLLGQLKGPKLQEFTLRLMRDQSFQQEVDKERIVMKTLWQANKRNAKQGSAGSRWILLLLLVVLSGGLIFYLLSGDGTAPPIDDFPIEENNTPVTVPIAANLAVNPTLEMLRNNPTRSALLQVIIDHPQDGAAFTSSQQDGVIQLSGRLLISDQSDSPVEVIGYVFSNKEEDFNDFKPLLSQTIVPIKTADEHYSITWDIPLSSLTTGRYYLLIGDTLEEELFLTQTFTVE